MVVHYTVVESRVQRNGSVRHLVEGPGGVIIVQEDGAGHLSGRIRSGYVISEESEEQTVARAIEAVHKLHQDRSQSAADEAQ